CKRAFLHRHGMVCWCSDRSTVLVFFSSLSLYLRRCLHLRLANRSAMGTIGHFDQTANFSAHFQAVSSCWLMGVVGVVALVHFNRSSVQSRRPFTDKFYYFFTVRFVGRSLWTL